MVSLTEVTDDTGVDPAQDQLGSQRVIADVEAYIASGLKYGVYR